MKRLHGNILTPQGFVAGALEFGADGRIARVEGDPIDTRRAREGKQPLLLPGFIDLHVHGGGGRDIMEGGDAAARVAELHVRHGTTSMLATTMTAPMSDLEIAFAGLKSVKEADRTLLDRTMVLYGTNLGDANAHSTTNLPTLFAGGGFRHGQHLAFDRSRNYPLPNLFVSMLERMGIHESSFGPSTGTMRGLEVV